MIRKLQPSDLLPIVYRYLINLGHNKIAKKLQKEIEIDLENQEGISGRQLNKICKLYIQNTPKLLKLYQVNLNLNDDDADIHQEEEQKQNNYNLRSKTNSQQVSKQNSRKNSLNQNNNIKQAKQQQIKQTALLFKKGDTQYPEQIDSLKQKQSQEEKTNKNQQLKINIKKKELKQQTSDEEEDSETEKQSIQKPKQKKNKLKNETQTQNDIKVKKIKQEVETQQNYEQQYQNTYQNDQKIREPFQFTRVDYTRVDQLKEELKDNSFLAKNRFGKGDYYGQYGHDRLIVTKGKDFRKEKGKLKNKMFQGYGSGTIDDKKINSIKL